MSLGSSYLNLSISSVLYFFNFLTANKPILLTFVKQIHPKELMLNKAKITTFHANV
jgi:hypothetical protein